MSDIYEEQVLSFDLFDDSAELPFDLWIDPEANPSFHQGQVRTQYEVTEHGIPIFEKEKSDYSISVHRLLWVDGWLNEDKTQQVTLVVLKFVFSSTNFSDSAQKLGHAKATLFFSNDENSRASNPRVMAWAPYGNKVWNPTVVHVEKTKKTSASAEAGYSDAKLALEKSKEQVLSFDKTSFDKAESRLRTTKGVPTGIEWYVEQNRFENQGLKPEFWGAVLLSRSSSAPYQVKFAIDASSGTLDNSALKAKKFFGLRGDGSSFLATPNLKKPAICNLEGQNILECIKLHQLGALVDPKQATKLNIRWGPKHWLEPLEELPEPRSGKSAAGPAEAELATATQGHSNLEETTAMTSAAAVTESDTQPQGSINSSGVGQAAGLPQRVGQVDRKSYFGRQDGQFHDSVAPPRITQHDMPAAGAEYSRLVALEGRVAQVESRLAAQDQLILQLQRALLANDA